MEKNFLKSSFREKLIEHLFIGELLKISWTEGDCSLEVCKPEVDSRGYDLILELNGIIRHVQLKGTRLGGTAAKQKVHTALAEKPSGCVLWIYLNEFSLELGPFLYFGGEPREPLPSLEGFRVSRHTKANAEGVKAERPEIRDIPKSRFVVIDSAEKVYRTLFGPC